MTTNQKQKGDRHEERVKTILEGMGYVVEKAGCQRVKGRYGWRTVGNCDFFGCIDAIAHRLGRKPIYIQCTTLKGLSERRAKLRAAGAFLDPDYVNVQLWGWDAKRHEFRIHLGADDFLFKGWTIKVGVEAWPWDVPKQSRL